MFNDIAILHIAPLYCTKFQNDLLTEKDVMHKQGFVKFEFQKSLECISYIVMAPRSFAAPGIMAKREQSPPWVPNDLPGAMFRTMFRVRTAKSMACLKSICLQWRGYKFLSLKFVWHRALVFDIWPPYMYVTDEI